MTMTRTEEIQADLAAVRESIREATKASSVSLDGHSLTRQSLDQLIQRERQLENDLAEILNGGSFRRTTFVRPTGLVQAYPYWTGQRYGYDYDDPDRAAPTIAVTIESGSPTVTVGLTPPP